MSDFIWFIVIGIAFTVIGLVFIRLGWLVRKEQRTDLLIRYRFDKEITEENKQACSRQSGNGLLMIGAGFAVSGIWTMCTGELISWLPMAVGLAAGTAMLVSAGIRYRH